MYLYFFWNCKQEEDEQENEYYVGMDVSLSTILNNSTLLLMYLSRSFFPNLGFQRMRLNKNKVFPSQKKKREREPVIPFILKKIQEPVHFKGTVFDFNIQKCYRVETFVKNDLNSRPNLSGL